MQANGSSWSATGLQAAAAAAARSLAAFDADADERGGAGDEEGEGNGRWRGDSEALRSVAAAYAAAAVANDAGDGEKEARRGDVDEGSRTRDRALDQRLVRRKCVLSHKQSRGWRARDQRPATGEKRKETSGLVQTSGLRRAG